MTSLVKKLDAEVEKSDKKMGAIVVLLTDDEEEEAATKIKAYGEKEGLKHIGFGVDAAAGPSAYKVAKDAAVTVLLYKKQKIEANHAFRKGEFSAKEVDAIVDDFAKIAPKKD